MAVVVNPGAGGFLTRQQFLKQHPGGNYIGYRNWVANTRAKRAAARTAAFTANPTQTLMTQWWNQLKTPAQSDAAAVKSVDDSISAQTAAIKAAYADQQKALAIQQGRTAGFANALADLQKNDPAGVLGDYRQSIGQMGALGTGLTGATADAQQANLDKANAAIAAATGGGTPGATGYDLGALRNAAILTNNVNPGMSMEGQALAAASRARADEINSQAGLEATSAGYGKQLEDILGQIKTQTLAVINQRPDMINKAKAAAADARNQQMATLLSVLSLQNQIGNTTSLISSRKNANAPHFDLRTSQSVGFRADQNGHPIGGKYVPMPGWKLNKQGNGVVVDPNWRKPGYVPPKNTGGNNGSGGTSTKPPKYTDWTSLRKQMMSEGAARLGLARHTRMPKTQWTQQMIQSYLMRNFGQTFISEFGQSYKAQVVQAINAASLQLYNQYMQRVRASKAANTGGTNPTDITGG